MFLVRPPGGTKMPPNHTWPPSGLFHSCKEWLRFSETKIRFHLHSDRSRLSCILNAFCQWNQLRRIDANTRLLPLLTRFFSLSVQSVPLQLTNPQIQHLFTWSETAPRCRNPSSGDAQDGAELHQVVCVRRLTNRPRVLALKKNRSNP